MTTGVVTFTSASDVEPTETYSDEIGYRVTDGIELTAVSTLRVSVNDSGLAAGEQGSATIKPSDADSTPLAITGKSRATAAALVGTLVIGGLGLKWYTTGPIRSRG